MADTFVRGFIRRIDFEPKTDFLGVRTYAHVFVQDEQGAEVDVYTDDPRLEAVVLAAYEPSAPVPLKVEVHYVDVGREKKLVRVILDREFSKTGSAPL